MGWFAPDRECILLFGFRRPRAVLHQWGGSTATFFTYTHLSHDLGTGLLTALLPLIRQSLGLSYLQSGLLLSAFTITAGLSQFPGGWIGDRIPRHIAIAIGLGGVSLTALAVGLSPSYYPMLFILVVMGIFAGAYHPSAVSMLSGFFEERRRGKVIALHMVGGSIGFTIGPVLGGLIAEFLGWRFAFIILSLPALAAVPLILKKFKQKEPSNSRNSINETAPQPMPRRISILQVLRPIAIIFILAVVMQLIAGSALAFIPIYLVDKHNIAPAYAAMMMGIVRIGGIAGSLFGGWLSDMWGRKKAIFLALVATGPVLYLLAELPFNAGFIVILILFGLLMYMRQATVQPFLMGSVPPQLRATIFGIYFGLGLEGRSLVQPIAGHFMDILGIVEVFTVIALISVGLSLAALLLAKKA
jgi:FSR family fosmidomycin resistance protein-like MFS transporter